LPFLPGEERLAMSQRTIMPTTEDSRESGNAIILSFLVLILLFALSWAQVFIAQKNIQSSNFFHDHEVLRKYAESGVELALHDMSYSLSPNGGNLGTTAWVIANDVGRDGVAATGDEGEGDGVPTFGEPNVTPVPVGEGVSGVGLAVKVFPTAWTNTARVVSTASNGPVWSTVDCYAFRETNLLPRLGAIYVSKGIALDLRGSFSVDGNDRTLDGELTGNAFPGISTDTGDPPGSNLPDLVAQIDPRDQRKVTGLGGTPSVAEATIDFPKLFEKYRGMTTQTLAPGTYTDIPLGNRDEIEVTYVQGDLHLSGTTRGCGILVVDGSLELTGGFTFEGLVLVSGNIRTSGTGSELKVLGSLMVGQALANAGEQGSARSTGAATLAYSSEAMDLVEGMLSRRWSIVYYDDR
jgi:hypothetical protein